MKVKLKKDWLGFKEGYEVEETDGVFEFISSEENVDEYGTSSSDTYSAFNLEAIKNNPELFEIVEEKDDIKMRTQDEVQHKLDDIYKDIELLKKLKSAHNLVHVLENMAYTLEWVLGNISFESEK